MTLEKIREELKTVRLYYTNKTELDAAFSVLPHKAITLVKKYADMISDAPLDLYRIYFCLYVQGLTQEAAAEYTHFSVEYIRQKNKSILQYFQAALGD